MNIKNIIFDLGGVLLNLDSQKTPDAFSKLTPENVQTYYKNEDTQHYFGLFERGLVTPAEFREQVKSDLDIEADDSAFDAAWCAILLDIPSVRTDLLAELKKDYSLYLFSNTNAIHYKTISDIYKRDCTAADFHSLFKKAYYSHTLGFRKPDTLGFRRILEEQNLNPEETLFVDDNSMNVDAARKVGLHAHLITTEKDVLNIRDFIREAEEANAQKNNELLPELDTSLADLFI